MGPKHNYNLFKNILFGLAGVVNLTRMMEKHVMPTPPLPTQVWHKALPSVFVIRVSGARRFGELLLHGWTPVNSKDL